MVPSIGCDTTFDRFDKQKPQCSFGIAGVCGADADLIVTRNLLRGVAARVGAHGAHARVMFPST